MSFFWYLSVPAHIVAQAWEVSACRLSTIRILKASSIGQKGASAPPFALPEPLFMVVFVVVVVFCGVALW